MKATDPVDALASACATTGALLGTVAPAMMDRPTPCAEWTVAELIEHIVSATDFFADLAEFGAPPEGRAWPDYASGDFIDSYAAQSARLLGAFRAEGSMTRMMRLPTGDTPGSLCIQVATGETFVHGWDLATALGVPMPGSAGVEVADYLLTSEWMGLSAQVRVDDPTVFAPALEVDPEASPMDRLVAFLGRDPREHH